MSNERNERNERNAKPPPPQPIANIVIHVGDYLLPDADSHGSVMEFRLFDREQRHYATITGHDDPETNALAVTDIRWIGRTPPNPNPHLHLGTYRSVATVVATPGTTGTTGDAPSGAE